MNKSARILALSRRRPDEPKTSRRSGPDDGFQLRHRRPAQCRQVDPVQCPDADRRGAGGELSRSAPSSRMSARRRARCAAGQARRHRQIGEDHSDAARASSTSPGWCAAPRRARASATSSSANIREVDAIVHVLRCFEDGDVIHVAGTHRSGARRRDVETELMLADLDSLEKRVAQPREARQERRQGGQGAARRWSSEALALLRDGKPARASISGRGATRVFRALQLLTAKPCSMSAMSTRHSAATAMR